MGGASPGGDRVILVVDDEVFVREVFRRFLQRAGYRVIEACSARDAIELLDSSAPIDLLVTDEAMPGMSGTTLLAHVRERWPCLPVLLVTGYDASATGADRVLEKPVRGEQLVAVVAELLSVADSMRPHAGDAEQLAP